MIGINFTVTLTLLILIAGILITLIYLILKELARLLPSRRREQKKGKLHSLILQLEKGIREEEKENLRKSLNLSALNSWEVFLETIPQYSRETKTFLRAILEDKGLVNRYIKHLEGGNKWRRARAAKSLGLIGSAKAVSFLLKHLTDPDKEVRLKAVKALINIGDERALPPLLDLLRDPQWGELSPISSAILSFGQRAEKKVLEGLEDSSPSARAWSAEILGKLRSRKAVEPLIQRLKDEEANVRAKSTQALGEIGDIRALDFLGKTCSDRSCFVRANAVKALGSFLKQPLAPDQLSFVTSVLIFLLGDREWIAREGASEALAKGDNPQIVSSLIKALSHSDRRVTCEAAEILGRLHAKTAFEPLVSLLEAEDPNLRASAAEALGRLGDKRATAYLIPRLSDGEWFVQARSAKALGELGDRKALDALYRATSSQNWWVRLRAKEAVETILGKTERKILPVTPS